MGATFAETAANGPLLLALGACALAGLISILSPCVLPLVPGYLSYVTGLAGADLDRALGNASPPAGGAGAATPAAGGVAVATRPETRGRGRVLAGTLLFVAGFTVVYLLLAILISGLYAQVVQHQRAVDLVVGVLVVLFGLIFLGVVPGLQFEWRIHRLPAAGLLGAPVLGAVFAISWAPCIGPTLGAVLMLAATSGGTGRAAVLAAAYCLGLGVPFVLFGLAYRRLLGVFRAIRRNSRWVTRAGGALLILTGLLMILGGWQDLLIWLKTTFTFGTDIGTWL